MNATNGGSRQVGCKEDHVHDEWQQKLGLQSMSVTRNYKCTSSYTIICSCCIHLLHGYILYYNSQQVNIQVTSRFSKLTSDCIGVGTVGALGACAPPKFHKLVYKLLTTLYVVSGCAPQSKRLSYAPGLYSNASAPLLKWDERDFQNFSRDFWSDYFTWQT